MRRVAGGWPAYEYAENRTRHDGVMTAYWVAAVRQVNDPGKLAAYAQLATGAIAAAGGRFLARGVAASAFEHGSLDRVAIIEFDSVEAGEACYASPAYQEALAALGDGAVRDVRIVPAA
jgi:uncharacterized protein (DUF1330 family)